MISVATIAALAALAPLTQGHYMFMRFSRNGKWEAPLGGIRNKTAPFEEKVMWQTNYYTRIYMDPTYVVDYEDSARCGRDNMNWASQTDVIDVDAGDTIEIAQQRRDPVFWKPEYFDNCPDGRGTCGGVDFNHPGPAIVHLSRAPDGQDIRTYDGSGEWVKIYNSGMILKADGTFEWPLYGPMDAALPRLTFKIPEQTPAGQYLMRMDVPWSGMINPYIHHGEALTQLYPSCAQINVRSKATGQLPKGVKIPEIFSPDVPGMEVSMDMYNLIKIDEGYEYPGGPLWDGEKLVVDKPVVSA